nr:NS3 [Dipteran jingmen-related virus]
MFGQVKLLKLGVIDMRLSMFVTLMIGNCVTTFTSHMKWWAPILYYVLVVEKGLMEWKRKESSTVYYVLMGLLLFFGIHYLMPTVFFLVLHWDQGKLRKTGPIFDGLFLPIYEWMQEVSIPVAKPLVGVHEGYSTLVRDWFEDLREGYSNFFYTGFDTHIEFIRDNGVTTTPLPIKDRPALEASRVHSRYTELGYQGRVVLFMLVTMVTFYFSGPLALLMMLGLVVVGGDSDEPKATFNEKNRGTTFRDGVYHVANTVIGYELTNGIGVSFGGVFHVPYHVTRGQSIVYGRTRVYPYYVNPDQDIVTYGGPPNVVSYQAGDKVFVNCETTQSRTSYEVQVDVDRMGNVVTWQGVTKPGESGSPVYAWRDEGMVLLGLAGRYIKEPTGVVEYTNVEPIVRGESMIEQITSHPGSGKTWKIIPDIVTKGVMSLNGKKVLVAGPTRVVCRELHKSMQNLGIRVGLNIRGSLDRVEAAPVQIAAHRTALKMLVTGSPLLRNLGLIVIDEAHMDDTATKLLRKYARHLMDMGVRTIELSATLDGITNDGSNHTITDTKIHPTDIEECIRERLEDGKRVLLFVPSIHGTLATRVARNFKEHKPIRLSRDTFETAMKEIPDVERQLIISTDIAECGINIPELDTVVDSGEKFTYVMEGNIIIGKKVGLTIASRTQRRGRVGRTKIGEYIEVASKHDNDYISASTFDADLLAAGRGWATGKTEWPLTLTDNQFRKWLDTDLTPLEIYLDYDGSGLERSENNKRIVHSSIKGGGLNYEGCGKCELCKGAYYMYDERAHDRIIHGKLRKAVMLN